MRIIREAKVNDWKVTLFKHDGKYTLQIENIHLIQSYKLRERNTEEMDQIWQKVTTGDLSKSLHSVFDQMGKIQSGFNKTDTEEDEFDTII